jgi:hypothetical protein
MFGKQTAVIYIKHYFSKEKYLISNQNYVISFVLKGLGHEKSNILTKMDTSK